MRTLSLTVSRPRVALLLLTAIVAALTLTACTGPRGSKPGTSSGFPETLISGTKEQSHKDAAIPPLPDDPPPPRLDDPRSAVVSYLYWISYAYRTGNSDVATPTLTIDQSVRIESYILYNRQQNRGIEQSPTFLGIKSVTTRSGEATVAAHEEWRYRYISIKPIKYSGPERTASYETTYTLLRGSDGKWRVDSVEASANSTVD